MPEDERIGAEPIVGAAIDERGTPGLQRALGEVAGAGKAVQHGCAEQPEQAHLADRARAPIDVRGAIVVHDRLDTALLRGVDDGISDTGQCLVHVRRRQRPLPRGPTRSSG